MLAALTPDVRNAWCSTKQNSLYNRGGFLHNAEVRATIARAQLPYSCTIFFVAKNAIDKEG